MPHGKYNALTDVDGIHVGHYTHRQAGSGVTVVLCPQGATAGVAVLGAAPGTRETDLLQPENLVSQVQAVVLAGGSVYGLSACDGVVQWLAARGHGFDLGDDQVAPIVPGAVLFDLGRTKRFVPPIDAKWGQRACDAAAGGPVAMGCVGAGTAAVAASIKGGVGTASICLQSGITVAALCAVNSHGSVINPETGRPWEVTSQIQDEFGARADRTVVLPAPAEGAAGHNTTIGVVATDAVLTKAQARKVAAMAHDGLARAIRPAHTMFDGDTIFCLGTAKRKLPETEGIFAVRHAQAISEIGQAAADCFARAVIHAVLSADSSFGSTAFRDLPSRKEIEIE